MKKLLGTLVIYGALLAACSNDDKALLDKEASATETEEAAVEQNTSTEVVAEPKKEITPKDAKKVVDNLVETAKKDALVDKVIIVEKDDQVNVQIKFPEDVSEQERGAFLFNYSLFIEQQYTDQEIKYSIEE